MESIEKILEDPAAFSPVDLVPFIGMFTSFNRNFNYKRVTERIREGYGQRYPMAGHLQEDPAKRDLKNITSTGLVLNYQLYACFLLGYATGFNEGLMKTLESLF
jgi:hypothetical protein